MHRDDLYEFQVRKSYSSGDTSRPGSYDENPNDPSIDKLWGIHERINKLRGHMSQQKIALDKGENVDDDSELSIADTTTLPQTYAVIKVHPAAKEDAVKWLVNKIRGKRLQGGAELVILREPNPEKGLVLHISASPIKFLEVAEEMEIVKRDRNGQMREFTVDDLENFLVDGMSVDDFLTTAERQAIVRRELENMRALTLDTYIPGYTYQTLYEGQSILHKCLHAGIITSVFALHDHEALKKLGKQWYQSFQKQPLKEIQLYFGESIALYFTFLGFYTTALLFPTFLGFLQLLVSTETVPFFCIFNVIWVTVFLEMWRRKSNELAYLWGTIGMTSLDEPRPNFRGQMGKDPVTGKIRPQYPRYKTYLKMYCVSFPIVVACLFGAFIIMLVSFWAEDQIRYNPETWSKQLLPIPSILYTALVYVMNRYYRILATFLTEWENHRTQSQFDRHRITKLILFEMVNNFMSLFYIAFIIQDMEMLRTQLATMLIILQAINNIQETVLPLFVNFYCTKVEEWKIYWKDKDSKRRSSTRKFVDVTYSQSFLEKIPEITPDDIRLEQSQREGQLENYEETYDDYLEMFIQFGYVILFSSVYPVAAFWAIINNVLEIRADAFKLCLVYQRPISRKVKDIGAWQRAFEVVGGLSIMTNCGLLCLSPHMRSRMADKSDMEWILTFVFLEHILLGIRYLLHITIPDKPEWVRIELAKRNYESRQALKHEKALRSKRFLTRRFKTVHSRHSVSSQSLDGKETHSTQHNEAL